MRFSIPRCLATVVAAIATVEILIMYWLPAVLPADAPTHIEALVDSLALAVLTFPILWTVLIAPLRQAADRSHHRYRAMVEHMTDAVLVTDQSGKILTANHAAKLLFGYEDDLQQQHIDHLLAVETSALDEASAPSREGWAQTKSGARIPVEFSQRETGEGDCAERVYVIRDISLRRERDAELAKAQQRLVEVSRLAGMSEVASSVLHNVGNVLNSVNVSTDVIVDRLGDHHIQRLEQVAALLADANGDIARLPRERLAQVTEFLIALAESMRDEQTQVQAELQRLRSHVDHINQIVQCQNAFAGGGRIEHECDLVEAVEDAIAINEASFQRHGIEVTRRYHAKPVLATDRHKVVQILVNLLSNAKSAVLEGGQAVPSVTVSIEQSEDVICIDVTDNGNGIAPEHLTDVFQHGFTTRSDGHGFGLHSSAIAAQDLGGSLTASSSGVGCGATFRLTIPISVREPAAC